MLRWLGYNLGKKGRMVETLIEEERKVETLNEGERKVETMSK